MNKVLKGIISPALLLVFVMCAIVTPLYSQYSADYYTYVLKEQWYDFVQDGIYYKFGTEPKDISDNYTYREPASGKYIDTSYVVDGGKKCNDGFYTGLTSDMDLLWVVGKPSVFEDFDSEGHWYHQEWNDTYSGDVNIPDSVEYKGIKYAVKGIASYAFYMTRVTSVRLPECLEYIVNRGFDECLNLQKKIHVPSSVKYLYSPCNTDVLMRSKDDSTYDICYPQDALFIQSYYFYGYDGLKLNTIRYPKNAIYGGQIPDEINSTEVIYPEKMRNLIARVYNNHSEATNLSGPSYMVIPNNGEFYVHQYGLPRGVSTIYSYAPIMKNCRPGYGFRTLTNVSEDASCQYEKTLYVLPGLKESYAKEWPELLAGSPYNATDGETLYLTEDHIIEVSREEMDAMVEAAGLTVPTAIHEVEYTPSKKVEEAIYTLDGRRWTTLHKGVNIVRQSNGTVRKVYVK